MDKKEKILKRIIMTGFITLGYSIVWMLLELLIKGQMVCRAYQKALVLYLWYRYDP